MTMQVLLDFVKQKPLAADTPNRCPKCECPDYDSPGTWSTLVGGANHHQQESTCRGCGFKYVYEWFDADERRFRNPWFTDLESRRVLLGVASCFETYDYDCAACGGLVKRRYTNLDGSETGVLSNRNVGGRWIREYRTFFGCEGCGKRIETPDDYWRPLR